jgi:hypothetical protein
MNKSPQVANPSSSYFRISPITLQALHSHGAAAATTIEWFFFSAGMLVISGGIFALMMGWAKSARAHVSETHHRKP